MTEHGQSAVLVMAAGAGTRMRSDTPKVLHTLAGRSMLSHVLHSVAKVAPQHLVVVLGHDRERITPAVDRVGRGAWPPDRHRRAGAAARHRARRRLRVGRPARRLRRHRGGDVWRRSADGRRHPGRPDRRPQLRNRRRDGGDDDGARPDGVRPDPAHAGPRGHRHRRGGRRDHRRRRPSARSTPACTRSTSRCCARHWTGCGRTTPSRSCTSPTSSRSSGRTAGSCGPSTSTTPRWWQASTTGCSWPSWPPS